MPVATCQRCGLIFAKFHPRPDSEPELIVDEAEGEGEGEESTLNWKSISFWKKLLLAPPPQDNLLYRSGRSLVLLGMLVWGLRLAFASIESNAAGDSLLHLINLPFHEAGHLVFRPFGQFISSLGGTLLQLLVPLICMSALLLKNRDTFGAAVCLWWFGENFLDIAPYINDAQAGVLPLLGGNTGQSAPYGFHDWEFLLTETGLLKHDQTIAKLAHGSGSLLLILAILWGGWLLLQQWRGAGANPSDGL